jgi:hypothetical protein
MVELEDNSSPAKDGRVLSEHKFATSAVNIIAIRSRSIDRSDVIVSD